MTFSQGEMRKVAWVSPLIEHDVPWGSKGQQPTRVLIVPRTRI